jgi:hypothetical protein
MRALQGLGRGLLNDRRGHGAGPDVKALFLSALPHTLVGALSGKIEKKYDQICDMVDAQLVSLILLVTLPG